MHPPPKPNKMTNNNNNDDNSTTTSLDFIAAQSKSMLNSLLPTINNSSSTTVQQQQQEGRNNNISPTNSTEEQREGIPTLTLPTYHSIRYAHLPDQNYTTITTKSRQGRRAYRLNLERPFNIHCEQSPLEYGDIFAPWSKEVRPKTVGPTEYCPPRHLGGEGSVWRQLLSFNDAVVVSKAGGGGEGGQEVNTGWRQLTEKELSTVQRLGERNDQGEYSFVTYDLSHIKKKKSSPTTTNTTTTGTDDSSTPHRVITPSTSLDSTSTNDSDDSTNVKSATTKANETARLFRRSELSLRDAAEQQAAREKQERDRRKAERKQKEKEELEALKDIKGAKGMSKRMSKRASLTGQMLMRKLSSSMGTSTTSASSGGSSSTRTMSAGSNYNRKGGIYEGGAMSRRKLVSAQAGMIEKAKDLIDEESDDEYDGEKYDETKKVTNMSLYIVGEYDVLNDLCLDGSKRLKNSKDLTDLEVLLQNEPCPPPNRWVRKTGWGKCNPSSMYAECPPEGFDWATYLNKGGPVKVNPVPRPVMQKS